MEIKHNHVYFHTTRNYSLFNTLKADLAMAEPQENEEKGQGGLFWSLILT